MNRIEDFIETTLDPGQMAAVQVDRNAVVSAGAGSGKTTVLSFRYLRLIIEGKAGVDEILTLTFTRKAAAEMHERIHRLLAGNSENPVVMEQLRQFDRAHISTLDSFCAKIVRTDCLRYGIPRDFRQDDDQCMRIARDAAEELVLTGGGPGNAAGLRELIKLHTVEQVIEKLLLPIASAYANPAAAIDFPALAMQQLDTLRSAAEAKIAILAESAERIAQYSPEKSKTLQQAQLTAKLFLSTIPQLSAEKNWDQLAAGISELKLWRKPASSVKQYELQLLRDETEVWKRETAYLNLLAVTLSRQDIMKACYQLAADFQREFINRKRRAGILSFSDIASLSVDILKTNLEVRRFYKKRYRSIMIDEFQDNNDLQRQLLYLLAEKSDREAEGVPAGEDLAPDKLFFVGDEKQSIYRFRGADVRVFKHLKESITEMGGVSLSLSTNYRSSGSLISSFNGIFRKLLKGEQDYEAGFELLKAGRTAPETPETSLEIMVYPVAAGEKDEPENGDAPEEIITDQLTPSEAEAFYIARYIRDSVKKKRITIPADGDRKPGRYAEYHDFAILLRSTSNQMLYEKACRHMGVPYIVQAARALYLEAPVNDIYQLLQLTAYPWDRHAYAGLLRSPFAALSDAALIPLLQNFDTGIFTPEAGSCIADPLDREKYSRISRLYHTVSAMADSVPVSEIIRYVWYRGGYYWHLLRRPANHAYLEYYDYLQGLVRKMDSSSGSGGSGGMSGISLVEFLDAVRPKLGENAKTDEMEIFHRETTGVQIMTIHKSKGLEFPVVILANAGNVGKNQAEPLLFSLPGESEPSLAVNPRMPLKFDEGTQTAANYFFVAAKSRSADMDAAELQRLLYVAMTRAQNHLLITGCLSQRNRSEASAKRHLLGMLFDALEVDPDTLEHTGDNQHGSPDQHGGVKHSGIRIGTIPAVDREFYEKAGDHRDRAGVQDYAKTAEAVEAEEAYSKADVITYVSVRHVYGAIEFIRNRYMAGDAAVGNNELHTLPVDSILNREQTAAFGTYCHSRIEQHLKRLTYSEREPELPSALQSLPEKDQAAVREAAAQLKKAFFSAAAVSDILRRPDARVTSEVPFLLKRKEPDGIFYIRGQIDILAEFPDHVVVIDLKSDRQRNPEAHRQQVELYCEAAARITGKNTSGAVVYLRAPEEIAWIQ
jgi:ATP-dependent exoDNAse (exonuclease V) beta subunit